MKKSENIFIVFLLLLILLNCSKNENEEIGVYIHDLTYMENTNITIELKDEVLLETIDESLISSVSDMAVNSNGNYIILDNTIQKLLMFNKEGKFVRTIGRFGKAPGEFQNPMTIFIDKNENIYLGDDPLKIIRYNPDGELLNYINFNGITKIMDFCIDDNEKIWQLVWYDDYLIHCVDRNGTVMNRLIKPQKNYEVHHKVVHDGRGIYYDKKKDNIYVFSRFSNTIYELKRNSVIEPIFAFEKWPEPPAQYRNNWKVYGPSIGGNINFDKWWTKLWKLENFSVFNNYLILFIYKHEKINKKYTIISNFIIYDTNKRKIIKNINADKYTDVPYMYENYFYVTQQVDIDDDGNLLNKKIQKYEIVFN